MDSFNELPSGKSSWVTLITNPTRFFEDRKDSLHWAWLAVILSVLTGAFAYLEVPYLLRTPSTLALVAHLSAAKLAVFDAENRLTNPIGAFLSVWISVFLLGLLIWLIAKLAGGKVRYLQVVAVVTYASVITLIGLFLSTVITLLTGYYMQSLLSIGQLFPSTSKAATMLDGIGVFPLWGLYVEICGISVLGNMTKMKAALPVVLAWFLLLL